jgi:hypothetical protein
MATFMHDGDVSFFYIWRQRLIFAAMALTPVVPNTPNSRVAQRKIGMGATAALQRAAIARILRPL